MKDIETIWEEYHTKLAAFIRSKVDEDVVDDLLQDVYIKIIKNIHTLEEGTKFESWLYQITRNTIIDHYRTRRISEQLPEWIQNPQLGEEEKISKDLSTCLSPMINELPEKYRNAIILTEIENKTQKELAEHEGISLSGAKSRVQRGRVLLQEMLIKCCRFELNKENQVIWYEEKEQDCGFC